jgi:hypothetical protein
MGGSWGYLWDLLVKEHNKYQKKKQFNTVDLKIKMDCDGCEMRVKKTLSNMKGFNSSLPLLITSIYRYDQLKLEIDGSILVLRVECRMQGCRMWR